MKFAIREGHKVEATKGALGTCSSCSSELIAKCGDVKVHHWAHNGTRNCDPWWENETEWHRTWKNKFPSEWQEVHMTDDQTGEKHIADIRTKHELVIEFQHSHIKPQERVSRENFYKRMVWVVDGTRLSRDYTRFLKGKSDLRGKRGYYFVDFPDECFPKLWLGCSVPLIFDFKGTELMKDPKDLRNHLYCLLPEQNGNTMLVVMPRKLFVTSAKRGVLFKEHQTTVRPQVKMSPQTKIVRREHSHYYDPKRGRFVKRRRL